MNYFFAESKMPPKNQGALFCLLTTNVSYDKIQSRLRNEPQQSSARSKPNGELPED